MITQTAHLGPSLNEKSAASLPPDLRVWERSSSHLPGLNSPASLPHSSLRRFSARTGITRSSPFLITMLSIERPSLVTMGVESGIKSSHAA